MEYFAFVPVPGRLHVGAIFAQILFVLTVKINESPEDHFGADAAIQLVFGHHRSARITIVFGKVEHFLQRFFEVTQQVLPLVVDILRIPHPSDRGRPQFLLVLFQSHQHFVFVLFEGDVLIPPFGVRGFFMLATSPPFPPVTFKVVILNPLDPAMANQDAPGAPNSRIVLPQTPFPGDFTPPEPVKGQAHVGIGGNQIAEFPHGLTLSLSVGPVMNEAGSGT